MEYRFALKKLRDIDLTKYEAYRHEDVHMSRDGMDRSIKMWINEPRKVIWDNTAANRDAENVDIDMGRKIIYINKGAREGAKVVNLRF